MGDGGTDGSGGLVSEINTIFTQAKSNRGDLEAKWNLNRDYFRRKIPVALRGGEGAAWRSDITPNLTKQKVVTAVSTVLGYYAPDGEIPFALEAWEPAKDRVLRDQQNKAIQSAQNLIKAQFKQCKAARVLRKCAFSAALYGMYAYQLDFYERIDRRWRKSAGGFADQSGVNPENIRWVDDANMTVQPGLRYASIWNCFWDIESDNPDEGTFLIHRVMMPARRLRQIAAANPGLYSISAIKRALENQGTSTTASGEDDDSLPPNQRGLSNRTHNTTVVEFHGWIKADVVRVFEQEWAKDIAKDAKDAGGEGKEDRYETPDEAIEQSEIGEEIHVAAAIVNGTIVMFTRSRPCDRPIRFGRFEIHSDEIEAEGVADNVQDDMKATTGLMRSAIDNALLSGDVMFAVREGDLDSPFSRIEPGAKILLSPDCMSVTQAIQQLRVSPTTAATVDLIRLLTQQAEDNSMMPRVASGLSTMQSRVTATQIREQMGQFEQTIGQFSALLDENLSEPAAEWFYQCNMLDPRISAEQKGDYRVSAKGYSNFKAASDSLIKMDKLFAFILSNPVLAAESKPREMALAMGRDLQIDAERFMMDAAEKREQAEMMSKMRQSDPTYQLGIAKMQGEVAQIQAKAESLAAQGQKALAEADAIQKKIRLDMAEFLSGLQEPGAAGQPRALPPVPREEEVAA